MKCFECGGPLEVRRENHKYACGLPYVTLGDIEVRRCRKCGDTEYVIPKVESLHRAIAHQVCTKPGHLVGEEVRFLRKYLGWSGADFASNFGVTQETVSRWEHDRQDMGPVAERHLRMCALHLKPVDAYPFKDLDQGNRKPLRLKIQRRKEEWKTATA